MCASESQPPLQQQGGAVHACRCGGVLCEGHTPHHPRRLGKGIQKKRASSDATRIPGVRSSWFPAAASTSQPLRPGGAPTMSWPALATRRAASLQCGCGCWRRRLVILLDPATSNTQPFTLTRFFFFFLYRRLHQVVKCQQATDASR